MDKSLKTIGLIGGMSWQSTQIYYQLINQLVSKKLGGLHSAKILLHSVDFAPIEKYQHEGNWQAATDILIDAALSLQNGGADFFVICTNTMHFVAEQVIEKVDIPLLHIADATAMALQKANIQKSGLLGTAFTMEMDFFRDRFSNYNIELFVPELHDRQIVHDIIYQELCIGQIEDESAEVYRSIIERLKTNNIESVILGCTEIGLLIDQTDTDLPLFDTTVLHAEAAVDFALG